MLTPDLPGSTASQIVGDAFLIECPRQARGPGMARARRYRVSRRHAGARERSSAPTCYESGISCDRLPGHVWLRSLAIITARVRSHQDGAGRNGLRLALEDERSWGGVWHLSRGTLSVTINCNRNCNPCSRLASCGRVGSSRIGEPMTSQLRLAVHSFPGERAVLLVHGFTSSAQIDWIEPGWPQALAAQGRNLSSDLRHVLTTPSE